MGANEYRGQRKPPPPTPRPQPLSFDIAGTVTVRDVVARRGLTKADLDAMGTRYRPWPEFPLRQNSPDEYAQALVSGQPLQDYTTLPEAALDQISRILERRIEAVFDWMRGAYPD